MMLIIRHLYRGGGGDFVLPNVSYVEGTHGIYYHAKEAVPTIYATYNTNLAKDMGADFVLMSCINNTENVKSLTIDGVKVDFEPPTKVSGTIEVLASQCDLANNTYSGSYLPKTNGKVTLKPKDPSIILNNNFSVTLCFLANDEHKCSPAQSDLFKLDKGNKFIPYLKWGYYMGMQEFGYEKLNACILNENGEPIDTLVEWYGYEGGLANDYNFTTTGIHNVVIELTDNIAPSYLLFTPKADGDPSFIIPVTELKYENIETIYSYHTYMALLNKLEFSEGLKYISSINYVMSSSIDTLSLPSTLEYIGDTCFYGASNLTSITCYANVAPMLENGAFNESSPTGTLYYPAGSDYSSWLAVLGDGWTGVEI